MMNTYTTSEVAKAIGIHPNTVRLYENLQLIPKPTRRSNGYRVFTDLHMEQFRLARLAFQVEVLQNGLRKKIVNMVKKSAEGDFDMAILLTKEYLTQIGQEYDNALEAAEIAGQILAGRPEKNVHCLTRKEVSDHLNISIDTLRNWEMNGLLAVRRKKNGYRIYTDWEIQRIKMIRSLRCAGYSLEAILNMLCQLSRNPDADLRQALNTPKEDADIISVYDKLLTSLSAAKENAFKMIQILEEMKHRFS